MNNLSLKVKLLFTGFVFLLATGVIGGSFLLNNKKDIWVLDGKLIFKTVSSKIAYAEREGGSQSLMSNIFSIFNTPKLPASSVSSDGLAKSVPVLVYHGIVENPDRFSTTIENFRDQMFALKKDGYQTISIQDFSDFVYGIKTLPDKSFLLTFDDGRKDSYLGADPVLKTVGFKATMFIAVGASLPEDKKRKASTYYLSKQELEHMLESGRWEIQSHGLQETGGFVPIDDKGEKGNFLSNAKWLFDEERLETADEYKARVHKELFSAKERIESGLKTKVVGFAYPFSDYGQQTENYKDAKDVVLKEIGDDYEVAFRQVWPKDRDPSQNYPNESDAQRLRRIEPASDWLGKDLLSILNFGRYKSLPYEDDFSQDNGWRVSWGDVLIKGKQLATGSASSTQGSFITLDGSYPWENYLFTAVVKEWKKGSHISVIGRFQNESNYVACTFNDSYVRVEQVASGKRTISEQKNIFEISKKNLNLAILVNKNHVSCLVDGNVVFSANIQSDLLAGGVSLKTWDEKKDNTAIVVGKVLVLPVISKDGLAEIASLKKKPLAMIKVVVPKPAYKSIPSPSVSTSTPKPEVIVPPKPVPEAVIPIALGSGYNKTFFFTLLGWDAVWGDTFLKEDGSLHTGANPLTTGSITILSGSTGWTDYLFSTKSDWMKGTTFSLVGRYKDEKNYLACVYTNYGAYVGLSRTINGKTSSLGKSPRLPVKVVTPWLDLNLSMRVKGNTVECLRDNEVIFQYTGTIPKVGGIGFKTWDAKANNANVGVKEIHVEPLYEEVRIMN